MGNITIRDIALQAGVSKSTASRVINNVGTVSEELRDRVNAVIERVGYQPSAIAQGLSRQDRCTRAHRIRLVLRANPPGNY